MAFGRLGISTSVASTNVTAYTVPANTKYAEISINIINTNASDATIKLAISSAATPNSDEYIEDGAIIPASGGILSRSDIVCSPGENIVVNSSNADCVIRVSGKEITK